MKKQSAEAIEKLYRSAEGFLLVFWRVFFPLLVFTALCALFASIEALVESGAHRSPFRIIAGLFLSVIGDYGFKSSIAVLFLFYLLLLFWPRKYRLVPLGAVFLIIYLWLAFRLLDLSVFYNTGSHINRMFLAHIEPSALGILGPIELLLLILPVFVALWITGLLNHAANSPGSYKKPLYNILAALAAVSLFTGLYWLNPEISTEADELSMEFADLFPKASTSPEKHLFVEAQSRTLQKYSPLMSIEPELITRLKDFGLHYYTLSSEFPLIKDSVYSEPLTYPKTTQYTTKPNIIIFAFESLSNRLLSHGGSPYKDLTPNIDEFASLSTTVYPTYNASTPTISGLVSIMCSHYPVFSPKDWMLKTNSQSGLNLLCLPEVLGLRGYTSYNVTPGSTTFARQQAFMTSNGVDEIDGMFQIKESLREEPLGRWGFSDTQVMRFVTGALKQGRYKEPFFLLVSTADFHGPYNPIKDNIKYRDGSDNIKTLLHTTDAAFGRFLEYFLQSPLSENSIVIVTADHSPYAHNGMFTEFGIKCNGYCEVPFLLYSPLNLLPETVEADVSSVDIAPSVLHLLGIDVVNSFEGVSVFDKKALKERKGILGSNDSSFFVRYNGADSMINLQSNQCDKAAKKNTRKPLDAESRPEACGLLDWWRLKRWVVQNNRIWKSM